MLYHVNVGAKRFEVEVGPDGVRVDGRNIDVDLARIPGTPVRGMRLDGTSYRVVAESRRRGAWGVHVRGTGFDVEVVDERTRAIRELTGAGAAAAGPKPIKAPMPGLVLKVEVAEGDEVQPGQGVVVVEAMKMENELKAEAVGTVSTVYVTAGDTVDKGQVLVDFEAPAPDDDAGEGTDNG